MDTDYPKCPVTGRECDRPRPWKFTCEICADYDLWMMKRERREKKMIYCYCEGCKHHDDDDTCKLDTITVSDREMTAAGFMPLCQEYEEDDT